MTTSMSSVLIDFFKKTLNCYMYLKTGQWLYPIWLSIWVVKHSMHYVYRMSDYEPLMETAYNYHHKNCTAELYILVCIVDISSFEKKPRVLFRITWVSLKEKQMVKLLKYQFYFCNQCINGKP